MRLQLGDDLPCGAACVVLAGHGAGEAMSLVAVVNPLSKEAQRLSPIMRELQSVLGLTITLHLNPELKMSEFPLENFYRYVVALEPKFDEAGASGRSTAEHDDRAVFASLRTPQVMIPPRACVAHHAFISSLPSSPLSHPLLSSLFSPPILSSPHSCARRRC